MKNASVLAYCPTWSTLATEKVLDQRMSKMTKTLVEESSNMW